MRLILATSNADKIKEIKEIYSTLCGELNLEILTWDTLITPFEILENGQSFKENALIKSKAVWNALKTQGVLHYSDIVLSDDSGICVNALGGKPGIHSARYSGGNAIDNLNLLCAEVAKLPSKTSKAHYCVCIGISSIRGDFSAHGFMYGSVISVPRGKNGFGYDPMFIPQGFSKTLAELSSKEKNIISHRTQALENAGYILRSLSLITP